MGLLILALQLGIIKKWEGELFQLPFKVCVKLRRSFYRRGHLILDPDGKGST